MSIDDQSSVPYGPYHLDIHRRTHRQYSFAMQQQMGSLAPHATGLCPRPRAADGRSPISSGGRGHRVAALTGRARLGKVTAHVAARPKYCRLHDKYFEVEMMVHDDELDEYGVVNNAIYASYIHSGRDVLLENLGISVDYWASMGNAMALSELNLKSFSPLRSGDRFVVKIRPVQIKGVRMIIHHLIETLPDRKVSMLCNPTKQSVYFMTIVK
ncbi:hypothetical protein EJB05_54111, partial [Eragrostis curvula]